MWFRYVSSAKIVTFIIILKPDVLSAPSLKAMALKALPPTLHLFDIHHVRRRC
jgi:hypothetical protein